MFGLKGIDMAVVRAVGLVVLIIILSLLKTPSAGGFDLGPHEEVLKAALGDGNTMSDEALKWIISSNKGSDLHQMAPERHFDGATNPTEICNLWKSGIDAKMKRAVELAAPEGTEKRKLKDRKDALEAFGEATHAIADFYSHTNWVELHESAFGGNPGGIPLAPILNQSCDPAAFPGDLQSGFFSMTWVTLPKKLNGTLGCPPGGPPRSHKYCHSQIAKDSPTDGHGKDKFGGGTTNYHSVAKSLATKSTSAAWRALHDRILAKYMSDTTDAECVFTKLAWGEDRSCHRRWGAKGKITTHGRYPIPGGTLLHDFQEDVDISFHTASVEYPGPKAPPVYADVRGTTLQNGRLCQTAITRNGTRRWCDPFKSETIGSDDARIKVTPYSEPIELDWRVTFPGKAMKCKGPVIVRIDPNAPDKQPFLECPGPFPGLTPTKLTYSGSFKAAPK